MTIKLAEGLELTQAEYEKLMADRNVHGFRKGEQKMNFGGDNNEGGFKHLLDLNTASIKEFDAFLRTGVSVDKNAWSTETTAGGDLIPEDFRSEVIRKLADQSVMRLAGARVFTTAHTTLVLPTAEGGSGAWTAENTQIGGTDPTTGQIKLTPRKYAWLLRISNEALRDAAVDIAGLLRDIFVETAAQAEDKAFFVGNDAATVPEPRGLTLDKPNMASVTAGTNIVEDLYKLAYKVKPQYRQFGCFFMRSEVASKLATASLATPNPVFDGQRFGPWRVFETDNLPETEGSSDVYFGDPRRYFIADSLYMEITRDQSRFMDYDQTAFRLIHRVDGKLATPEAFAVLEGVTHNGNGVEG